MGSESVREMRSFERETGEKKNTDEKRIVWIYFSVDEIVDEA